MKEDECLGELQYKNLPFYRIIYSAFCFFFLGEIPISNSSTTVRDGSLFKAQLHTETLHKKNHMIHHILSHPKKTLRSPKKFTYIRNFINCAITSNYLQKHDHVLIAVPEDMLIHGMIDSSLHYKTGTITGFKNGDVEVTLGNTQEKHCIPKFCLCLEDVVLYSRMKHLPKTVNKSTIVLEEQFDGNQKFFYRYLDAACRTLSTNACDSMNEFNS